MHYFTHIHLWWLFHLKTFGLTMLSVMRRNVFVVYVYHFILMSIIQMVPGGIFLVFFFQNCYQISFCKVHTVKTVKQLSTRYVICCMFACFDVYVYMYVQSSHVNKLLPHTDIVTACAGSSGGLVLFR